jgi:hypothetical protein
MRGSKQGRAVVAPTRERIAEGVELATGSDGTLTLRGRAVDAELRAALIGWLKTREKAAR